MQRIAVALLLMLVPLAAANEAATAALFAAVRANNATAVRAAASAGARLNEQQPPLSPAKQTPLMHASLTGAPEAAAALLAQCDGIRDKALPGLGWALKDGPRGPVLTPL